MDKDKLISELYSINAIKYGSFTLKSGATSSFYIDLRSLISYPQLLQAVTDLIWQRVKSLEFDLVCGVPYTALPMATALSLKINKPMVMVRKEQKNYGTKQMVEGRFQKGQRCLLIEDVVTTGTSILETIDKLKAVELEVPYVICVVDREQGGAQHLQPICQFLNIIKLSELLPMQEGLL